MNNKNSKTHDNIIIIRRANRADHSEHHGGAWKIAYADFVTAMMAFFLVMWLINVTSDETKISIASYFNPIKFSQIGDNPLSDNASEEKPKDTPKNNKKEKANDSTNKHTKGEKEKVAQGKENTINQTFLSEEKIMLDPFQELNEIEAGQQHIANGGGLQQNLKVNSNSGDAYRDFIIPEYSKAPQNEEADNLGKRQISDTEVNSLDVSSHFLNGRSVVTLSPLKNNFLTKKEQLEKSKQDTKSQAAAEVARELKSLETLKDKGEKEPAVHVSATKGGLLIELTDRAKYAMFDIGSSRPDKNFLNMMSKIAKILNKIKGKIVIRGHTDARPYKNKHYDNWQLSIARAQIVYYMLRRGGIRDDRFARIEGHADHMLQNKKDPNAAENRRIEILLQSSPETEKAITQLKGHKG